MIRTLSKACIELVRVSPQIQPDYTQASIELKYLLFQGVELEAVDFPVTPTDANVAMEREPRHLPLGISMRNLKKVILLYFKCMIMSGLVGR